MDGYYKRLSDYLQQLEDRGVPSDLVQQGRTLRDELKVKYNEKGRQLSHLKTLMDHVPCTISHISNDLRYLAVNKFLADSCDSTPEEFVGQKVGFKSTYNQFNAFSRNLFNAPEKHVSREIESEINGQTKYFFVQGIKINHDTEALIIGVDITELTVLKDTVVFLDRLSSIGEMMAGILHEISNPLMLIKNYGTKLQKMSDKKQLDEEEVAKVAEVVCRTSDKIEKIVAGIKAFVRMSHDDVYAPTSFAKILEDSVLICESLLQTSGVELIKKKESWPQLMVNETQIFQVFVNLITNSIHAVEDLPEKWVEVDWREDDGSYIFYVTDSGSGIDQEVQEKMFSSFYTTKGVGKGTGLGLSLCFKILEKHKGNIYVDSDHPNTRFVIEIPK